jgi:hypothetical protein
MAISDTSPKVEAMQLEALRSMTGGQRVLMGMEICLVTRELMKAGIREKHPEWSERQVKLEMLRLLFFPKPLPTWMR